jgi:hypothetical protein
MGFDATFEAHPARRGSVFRFVLDLSVFSGLFLLIYGRLAEPTLGRVRRLLGASVRSGRLEEVSPSIEGADPAPVSPVGSGSAAAPRPLSASAGSPFPRPLSALLWAVLLLGEIYLQSILPAYAAGRVLHALAGGLTPRWIAYALAFLAAEAPLCVLARRVESISYAESLRSIVPMGLFVSFCVHPHQLSVFAWLLPLIRR